MENLHNNLCQKYSWYDRWHGFSASHHFHWGAFVAVALFLTTSIVTGIMKVQAETAAVPQYIGVEYYVDPKTGNDDFEGRSPEAPWKTLDNIVSNNFQPGDKIYLKAGEIYRQTLQVNSSGALANPIYLSSYGKGAPPVVSALDTLSDWIHDSGNKYSRRVSEMPNAIYQDGKLLKYELKYEDLNAPGEWYYNGLDQVLVWTTDNLSPSEHEIAAAVRSSALHIVGQSFVTVSGIDFVGSNTTSATDGGAALIKNSSYITLRNSTVSSAGAFGLSLIKTSNARIENNLFEKNGQEVPIDLGSAVYGQDNVNAMLIKNTIRGNSTNGMKLNGLVGGSVFGNDIENNIGSGMVIIRPAATFIQQNNIRNNGTENSGYFGLVFKDSLGGNEVTQNLITGQLGSGGLHALGAQDTKIYSNLLYGNQLNGAVIESSFNLWFTDNTIYGLGGGISQYGLVLRQNRELQVYNNNVFDALQYAVVSESSQEDLKMDYNNLVGRKAVALWGEKTYENLDQLSQVSGTDKHSLSIDPKFTSIFEKDFSLLSDSPLVNAGFPTPAKVDFDGKIVPVGTAIDIGAFEQ